MPKVKHYTEKILKKTTNFILGKRKIFVISFQRTGTTSTGQFFKDHGFSVANWSVGQDSDWTRMWLRGQLSDIINSKEFREREVFEDDPWWLNDFYKYLFHELPHSHFILLERDSDAWFNSMLSHSNGKTFMNTHLHLNIYRREEEMKDYPDILLNSYTKEHDKLLQIEESHREHYKKIYEARNFEVKLFFEKHGPERLFKGNLSDPEIWQKMGDFFKIKVARSYNTHKNKSKPL